MEFENLDDFLPVIIKYCEYKNCLTPSVPLPHQLNRKYHKECAKYVGIATSKKWHKSPNNRGKDQEYRRKRLTKLQSPPTEYELSLIETANRYNIVPGIYQLFFKNKRRYIGSTKNIAKREVDHRIGPKSRRIEFDYMLFSPYYKDDIEEVEQRLIFHYKPPDNKLKFKRTK